MDGQDGYEWVWPLLHAAPDEQTQRLNERGLLSPTGLEELLTVAEARAHHHPQDGVALVHLVGTLAEIGNLAPQVMADAAYLEARLLAQQGQFQQAEQLIERARITFERIGQQMQAWRTQIGLMNILGESGRVTDALTLAEQLLAVVAAAAEREATAEAQMMLGLVQQNRGRCFEYLGRFEDALTAYDAAETHFQVLDRPLEIGQVDLNRGLVLLDLGRVSEATDRFERALAQFVAADRPLFIAQARTNLADAAVALGDFEQALQHLNIARTLFQSLDIEAEEKLLAFDMANHYLALNLYPEAETAFQEAGQFFREREMSHYLARNQWGLGIALAAQRQAAAAQRVLTEAVDLLDQEGHPPLACAVMVEEAAVLTSEGKRGLALQKVQAALNQLGEGTAPVQRALAHLRLADLLLPDLAAAEKEVAAAADLAATMALPHLAYRVAQRQGHLRLLAGDLDQAQGYLEQAIALIERSRSTLPLEALRLSFLQDKTAAYEQLMQLHLMRNNQRGVEQAFAVAEQAKSRSLVDLLLGLVQLRAANEGGNDQRETLETLQQELNVLYNSLFGEEDHDGSHESLRRGNIDRFRQKAEQIERQIQRLELEINLAEVVHHGSQTVAAGEQAHATPILAYHIVDGQLIAFICTPGQINICRDLIDLTTCEGLVERLNQQWSRFRAGVTLVRRHARQLELSTVRLLAQLYDGLIRPLAAYLPPAGGRLAVVPFGPLHQLPFHALFDGTQFLLERYEIAFAPSATIFELCQQRPYHLDRPGLFMGVADPLIPQVEAEIAALDQLWGRSTAFLNEAATTDRLKQAASSVGLVHLACHGLYRADNPMFSSLRLADRWLQASELMRLSLNGALITLSACESGRNQVVGGDELVGFSRAALGAGAAGVVVSLWLVSDPTTATMMTHFYQQLASGLNPAAALRQAQLALKAEFPHPFYWAPFILTGHF